MNKTQYQQAYRLSRMLWNAYLNDDKAGKKLIKRSVQQYFTHTEFLYAERSRIMSYDEFSTVYCQKGHYTYSEYNPIQVWNMIKRRFPNRLKEVYQKSKLP